MDKTLRIIIFIISLIFLIYILLMIGRKKVELKYTLIWLGSAFIFVILSIFPQILFGFSNILHIISPVNTLFLMIIFLLLIMVFTLTVALSKIKKQITAISQELGILKCKLDKWKGKE